MAKFPAVKWTREHLLIALNLYCVIPFGSFHRKNPIIIKVAEKLGRTPNSLAMQLCNFASLDPIHRARGIKGLERITPKARAMWEEYQANISTLGPESEQLLHDLFTEDQNDEVDLTQGKEIRIVKKPVFTESCAVTKTRRGQDFFRKTILSAYEFRCCISGVNVPELLVASHIKPWAEFADARLDPKNGLCLSSIHDAAFDCGLITFDEDLRLVLSKRLRSHMQQPTLKQCFLSREGKRIRMPKKIAKPSEEYLSYHRDTIFQG